MHTMSNRGTPVASASAPFVRIGTGNGLLQRSTGVRRLDSRSGYSWWEYHYAGSSTVCFARLAESKGRISLTSGPICGPPNWPVSGWPALVWALWACFPGDTVAHPISILGVAVDGVATVSTVAASGRVVAKVNVVKNHFIVPDDGTSNAVKIVFKNRAGKIVLVKTAGLTPVCDRGGPTPAPVPAV
jgi:hypothetical protein